MCSAFSTRCDRSVPWMKTTFEDFLAEHGTLTYTNTGVSMLPMLKQGRDTFTVAAKTEARCKKYDVVLYRRPPAQYVLHRIIEVREKDYVILGDNCINKECGITDRDILGVLTEFTHKGKTVSADNRWYRLYSRLWVGLYPARKGWQMLKAKVKSALKALGIRK